MLSDFFCRSVHPAIPTPHCTDIDNVLNGDGKTITIKQQFSNCDSSEQRHMTEQAECVVDRCLSFCTFSFGHYVVCPSIYGS